MERHRVLWLDVVHGNPPVDLTERRRVPGVAMWVERIGDTGRQVAAGGRSAQPRHVEIRLGEVAPELAEDPREQLLARRVMDETRLQRRENLDVFLHRKAELRRLRIQRRKRLSSHLLSQADQLERARRRREEEELPVVNGPTPGVVGKLR